MAHRRFPALGTLRAFEVLARTGTLAKAADELCVTPSAVGHQVRALEAWLGTALFEAKGRQRVLTAAGERLAGDIGKAFDQLDLACRALHAGASTDDPAAVVVDGRGQGWARGPHHGPDGGDYFCHPR